MRTTKPLRPSWSRILTRFTLVNVDRAAYGMHIHDLWSETALQVEMILQAHEYEEAQGANLEEFFASTKGKFQTDLGKAWAAEIVSRRDSRTQKTGQILQQQ